MDKAEKNRKARYIVIGRSSCSFCVRAMDYLYARELDSVFLDYEENKEILEDYKGFYKQDTVPIILKNELNSGFTKRIGGFDDLLKHDGEE